jgi:hypothetical protein
MNTYLSNLKVTAITLTQDLVKTLTFLKLRLLTLLINGIAFLCIISLFIAATILLNDRHLHVSVTVDNQELVLLDLKRNH